MSVSLIDLQAHLNITTSDDDALLERKLAAATTWVQSFLDPELVEDIEDAPAPVNEAILQLAAHLYENREATLVGVSADALPFGVMDLLTPYRAWAF